MQPYATICDRMQPYATIWYQKNHNHATMHMVHQTTTWKNSSFLTDRKASQNRAKNLSKQSIKNHSKEIEGLKHAQMLFFVAIKIIIKVGIIEY